MTVFSVGARPVDARYEHRPIFLDRKFLYRSPLERALLLPAALNLVDFRGFDVLHLHGDDWFLLRRPIPTVRTFHGSALREAQHAVRRGHRTFMYGIYGLEVLSSRLCDVALATGGDTASIYGTHEMVVPGVDEAVFHPGAKHPTPKIFFVGTWKGRKRGQFVYDAFVRDVLPRFPDAELAMACDYVPAHPRVTHDVTPDDATLAQRFRESWVFALASTYEGFGIPYLEALASGTPVVATPNPGASDVLDGGRYGVLASDDAFGAAIVDLLASPARREEAMARGLERARQYSWRASADRHRELYARVIRRA